MKFHVNLRPTKSPSLLKETAHHARCTRQRNMRNAKPAGSLVPETDNITPLSTPDANGPMALGRGAQSLLATGQGMTDLQQTLVIITIQNANPCPDDVEECVLLLLEKRIFSSKKIDSFLVELQQVCTGALDVRAARDARPSTPATAIPPSSSADPVPSTVQIGR